MRLSEWFLQADDCDFSSGPNTLVPLLRTPTCSIPFADSRCGGRPRPRWTAGTKPTSGERAHQVKRDPTTLPRSARTTGGGQISSAAPSTTPTAVPKN